MKTIKTFLTIIFCVSIVALQAKAPVFPINKPDNKPHRIIRTCCSFGSEMQLMGIPGIKLTDNDLVNLAGKIAYDLSVWHEIATWFGASTIPFVPERYSSFSVEDVYSNY
ncbi:MAG: DUF4056 domain-containing protein [Bacteroidota bacterium]|nr:DUF4056 domain-containing protein [Bacteroidota bacterium]